MTSPHVVAPVIDPDNKPKGPASYFLSIEEKYGHPMQHWLDLVVERLDAGDTHMQVVSFLKADHEMGHGHANAVVAYVKTALAD